MGDEEHDFGRIWPGGALWRAASKGAGKRPKGLESVDVAVNPLGEELWLVLGEDNRTLSDLFGTNSRLPKRFREVCGRGPEGLSLRWQDGVWQVALVVEGGLYDRGKCGSTRPEADFAPPRLLLLTWVPGEGILRESIREFPLEVTAPSPGQHFRAPDLAWMEDGSDRLILLLASTAEGSGTIDHHWLQLFDLSGAALGEPMRLEDAWGKYRKRRNWEALDTVPGGRLVMGFDTKKTDESVLVVFPNPFE